MDRPLRFRVSFKFEKRGSKNGDMFVFHAMDGKNEMQTQSFFDIVQYNRTYELTNFNVKKESADYPDFIGNPIFIGLLSASKLTQIEDDAVRELEFNFSTIEEIKSMPINAKCDFIAVIAQNWGNQVVGNKKMKRDLTLTDKSKECILTLWGEKYSDFDFEHNCILVHNGLVGEYNGNKTLSCSYNTTFINNPELIMASDLKSWFDKELQKIK